MSREIANMESEVVAEEQIPDVNPEKSPIWNLSGRQHENFDRVVVGRVGEI